MSPFALIRTGRRPARRPPASRAPRLGWAVVLLWVGAGGCAFTPVQSPDRRSAQFGPGPDARFRVGETPRAAVYAAFGSPSYSTRHDRACGYLFAVTVGREKGLLMGPCMPYVGEADVSDMDDVWLEFDDRGILRRVEKHLVARHSDDDEQAWRTFARTVPDPIRPEQMLDGRP